SRIYGTGENAVIIYCVREEAWFRLAEMVELSARPEFEHMKTEAQRVEHASEIDAHIEGWLHGRTYSDIIALARAHRVPMAPACTPETALTLARALLPPQERAISGLRWLKDHPSAASDRHAGMPRLPDLRGMVVVEMSTGWSMPLVGRILAFLGAKVIK